MTLGEDNVLPSDYDLVLEVVVLPRETICGYYFADHGSRLLFWLDMFDAEPICDEIHVVVSLSHLREC